MTNLRPFPRPVAALGDRLDRMVAELSAIRQQMSGEQARMPPDAEACERFTDPDRLALGLAQVIVGARNGRSRLFRADLFSDPAWDMLLDLFIARLEGNQICVSSLCIAARVPGSTAHRWIKAMLLHGEIVRRADPDDGRRVFVEISQPSFEQVRNHLLAFRARLQAMD